LKTQVSEIFNKVLDCRSLSLSFLRFLSHTCAHVIMRVREKKLMQLQHDV